MRRNFATAIGFFRAAADAGYAMAQNNLGLMYSRGLGVTQNHRQAVAWYRAAAQQGNASAQFNLGAKYANGEGVELDYLRAHMWWNIAAGNGHKNAGFSLENIEMRMQADDIGRARELAKTCSARRYRDC